MPPKHEFDHSIPPIARRFPLAAALLSSWEHTDPVLTVTNKVDMCDMVRHRQFMGIPLP